MNAAPWKIEWSDGLSMHNPKIDVHNTEFSKEWIEMGLAIKNRLVDHILIDDAQYIEQLRSE